ncbi:MAG: hypothetical protein ACP5XB_24075 [Isosphaeraceae bacterium]
MATSPFLPVSRRVLVLFIVGFLCCGWFLRARAEDLDTQFMHATVKLSDPDASGTAFVLSRVSPKDPKANQFFLVTAEHILSRTKGEEVTLIFHRKKADGGYEKAPIKLRVRQGGKVLWAKHPALDVAILPITPPGDVPLSAISVDLLASDADLRKFEIHPGDMVRCIGYPHPNQFEPGVAGFGVLRAGCIAGFPILPTHATKTLLLDMNCFEGDSGAPVYLVDDHRLLEGKTEPGRARLIVGMMIGQHFIDEEYKMIYQTGRFRHRMGFAIVVHASAIKETIDLLTANRR